MTRFRTLDATTIHTTKGSNKHAYKLLAKTKACHVGDLNGEYIGNSGLEKGNFPNYSQLFFPYSMDGLQENYERGKIGEKSLLNFTA